MNRRSLKLLNPASLIAMLLLMAIGCERRPLHVLLDETVTVNVEVDWKINFVTLYDEVPNGMSLMLWQEGDNQPQVKVSNSSSISVSLQPGIYYLVVFNELREDYSPKLSFYDITDYDKMTVRANSYMGSTWDQGVKYMYSPYDPRICVALDTIEVTNEMISRDTTVIIPYDEFIKTGSKTIRESEVTYSMPEITWPMTADLYIKAKVKHRQSIKSIDGSISGMADGFRVSHINRTSESGTLRFYPEMFENFKLGEDADSMGLITVRVPTFGLPFGKELLEQREDGDNILTFHVTLVNDSIHHESFRVGKQIRYITPEGKEAQVRYREDLRNLLLEIDLSETIVVPIAEKPVGAGFDAKVDDWDDGGSIDIGL